jgi:hypothetical protein
LAEDIKLQQWNLYCAAKEFESLADREYDGPDVSDYLGEGDPYDAYIVSDQANGWDRSDGWYQTDSWDQAGVLSGFNILNEYDAMSGAKILAEPDAMSGDNILNEPDALDDIDWYALDPFSTGPDPPLGADPQQAIIRAPDLNDKLEAQYSKLFPNMARAREKELTGFYDRYPFSTGPLYDALPDLAGMAAGGILGKAGANAAELGNIVSGGAWLAEGPDKGQGGRLGNADHRAKVAGEAQRLENEGHTIVAGGGLPEQRVYIHGGDKPYRYPDIISRDQQGNYTYTNVGETNKLGSPIKREWDALQDLKKTGENVNYVPLIRK